MNLFKQINDWLLESYEPFYGNWIYFNATPYIVGAVATNSVAGNRVVKKDILGNKYKELVLAVDFIKEYDSSGTSDLNLDFINEIETFNAWIEYENKNKFYPDFGDSNIITSIEVLTNVPNLLVDNTQNLAKYQIQIKFNYIESEVF